MKALGWYENQDNVYIAMEYFPLGDLQKYLSSPLSEGDTQMITYQVLEGLSFMHDNGFVHRDLKPNVSPRCHLHEHSLTYILHRLIISGIIEYSGEI